MNRKWKTFLPVMFVFIGVIVLLSTGRHLFEQWNVDSEVIYIGNFILFIVTCCSYLLAQRGVTHSNSNVFFRTVYGSIMIKLFVCIIAAFVYISVNRGNLNKPALFICMGLYLLYTFVEVSVLMKLLKQKTNG
jgi:hypothetical protein